MRQDREQCLAAGMDDYVSKPMQVERPQRALERAATRRDESRRPTGSPPEQAASLARGSAGAPLDPAVIANLKALRHEGRRDIFSIMLNSYCERTPQLLSDIRSAIEAADALRLMKAGHELKGASQSIGAWRMGELSERLETIGRAESVVGAAPIAEELGRELQSVAGAINRELGEGG
jgi:HPt (histidine-containing phosphotransfer) domain-containing protein